MCVWVLSPRGRGVGLYTWPGLVRWPLQREARHGDGVLCVWPRFLRVGWKSSRVCAYASWCVVRMWWSLRGPSWAVCVVSFMAYWPTDVGAHAGHSSSRYGHGSGRAASECFPGVVPGRFSWDRRRAGAEPFWTCWVHLSSPSIASWCGDEKRTLIFSTPSAKQIHHLFKGAPFLSRRT